MKFLKDKYMLVYSKLKSLGSGKIGSRPVKADSKTAVRLAFLGDARIYYKVFGREKARKLLKDSIYTTDLNSLYS